MVCRTVFVYLDDSSYHKKAVSNILTFGNDWKACETDDGCQYVLGKCFVKEDGQGSSISKEELNQYKKTFGNPIKQLEITLRKKGGQILQMEVLSLFF